MDCLKDLAEPAAKKALTVAGYAVVKTALLADKWVTFVKDTKSRDEELIIWHAIGNTKLPGTGCLKWAFDRVVKTGNGATEGGGGGAH